MELIGKKAPDFNLPNGNREVIQLSKITPSSNVVLLFYPLAFSSVCTTELCTVRDNMKLYEAFNATVFGISVDSLYVQAAFKRAQNLNFELLSDFNKVVSRSYGVLYDDFYGMKGVSKRSAFVIDQSGIVRYAEILEDERSQPNFNSIQEALALLS